MAAMKSPHPNPLPKGEGNGGDIDARNAAEGVPYRHAERRGGRCAISLHLG